MKIIDNFKVIFICMAFFTTSFAGCNENEPLSIQKEDCMKGKTLKSAKNRTGKIYYNKSEKKYAIYVSEQGTFDSQDIGFLCNPPDSLKKEGLSVTFNGEYYKYEEGRIAPVGGATYYYLQILKLKTN